MTSNSNNLIQSKEFSLMDIFQTIKKYYHFLLRKWLIICIFGFGGAAVGLSVAFLVKPKYTANLSFALVEKSSGGGGLADLASSFGFSSLLGGGSNGAFSGDNLLEIIKSRKAIELTLLTPVEFNGKKQTLMEAYLDFSEIKKKLAKEKKNFELRDLAYPVGQDRKTFNRTQDSMLFVVYDRFVTQQMLKVTRKDKKISIVQVNFTSKNELFSKLFVETLMDQTYVFYRATKTSQSRYNIDMMQAKADSVKALYESALYKGASISTININQALQLAAVPRMNQESDAKIYGTVYAEILKNIETLKLDLARETPLVQLIDEPVLPLKKDKVGKLKGLVYGGLTGGLLIVIYLIILLYIKELKVNLKS